MEKEQLLQQLENFEDCINEYINIFMETYPTEKTKKDVFPPKELLNLAIQAQSTLAIFGNHATKRFKHIGFFELFSFDNPVDWYSWRNMVVESNIDFSTYASISFRIESEINRIRFLIEQNQYSSYENLSIENYLVSKDKYFEKLSSNKPSTINTDTQESITNSINIHISQNDQNEQKAFQSFSSQENIDQLELTHKGTSIVSNILNGISKITGLLS